MKMPVYFIGHGSPMNAIENNEFTHQWEKLMKDCKPKAILIISAHWMETTYEITTNPHPAMIYDMFGFPNELYTINYPAHTDESIIKRCCKLVPELKLNNSRGYDHGVWSILTHMAPLANIPVIQISLSRNASLEDHYNLGKALRTLRDEDVLIIGSGNIVHNLRELNWNEYYSEYPWAKQFKEYVNNALLNCDYKNLIHYDMDGYNALMSVNSQEHYLPMLVCLGASDNNVPSLSNDVILNGSLSMTCVAWK